LVGRWLDSGQLARGLGTYQIEALRALAPEYKWAEFWQPKELEDTIAGKQLWQKFQSLFGTKELLASKFGQLSELRNPLRQGRAVDEVTQKEGEAAIIWFERILGSMTDGNSAFA
jgi:hypothetical protein